MLLYVKVDHFVNEVGPASPRRGFIIVAVYMLMQSKTNSAKKALNATTLALLKRSDKRMVAIPMVFVLLRCWGTLHFFYSLAVSQDVTKHGCTNTKFFVGFFFLAVMQVSIRWSNGCDT